ncbi:MAG TPA: hypothetical protein VFL29_09975 [Candidatus Dormibacteraeota bacterium]|nr:hypothetical protein [Candidatus Dormibacteraeota bacterium]
MALAVALAAVMLGACGTVIGCVCGPAVLPTPPPPRTPSPTAGFDVVISDNDRAVTVRSGQRIELILHAKPGMSAWSGVNVDDYTVLRAVPTGILAPVGVTIAGYEAERRATATIRATATPLCSPGEACPAYAMIFEVRVTVT